jgi:crotonobetainyl-CoA:carnitine CoA-transferase CaiB-like acyl-CoA transferase
VASLDEAVRDPHFAARGLFSHLVGGPSGATMPALPVPIAAEFRATAGPLKEAPELGADSDALVGESRD